MRCCIDMGFCKQIIKPYSDIRELLSRYWKNYGGWKAVLLSPYFHLAFLVGIFTFPYGYTDGRLWWDLPINILPSLVGFSLGGYAIFLAFGDEKFKRLISGNESDVQASPYLELNTTFLHFILVQISALILAVAAKSTNIIPQEDNLCYFIYGYGLISYMGFLYALFLAMATTVVLYRLICLHDKHLSNLEDEEHS